MEHLVVTEALKKTRIENGIEINRVLLREIDVRKVDRPPQLLLERKPEEVVARTTETREEAFDRVAEIADVTLVEFKEILASRGYRFSLSLAAWREEVRITTYDDRKPSIAEVYLT